MSQILTMKHTMTEARDCRIEWDADFDKMTLNLRVDFISPALLLDFLRILPLKDDRFAKAGIVGAVSISKHFNVFLELSTGAVFKLLSYQSLIAKHPEIELYELEEKGAAK